VTLETNSFRQRLVQAFGESPRSKDTSSRYVAALVAVRYGLRDALVDWMLIYTICYAIVGGVTWKHAEPNSGNLQGESDSCSFFLPTNQTLP